MSHPELPHYLIREIAANMNYKDLPSMCLSSRLYYETLCNNNYFWKLIFPILISVFILIGF